jgi:hypothetical protein
MITLAMMNFKYICSLFSVFCNTLSAAEIFMDTISFFPAVGYLFNFFIHIGSIDLNIGCPKAHLEICAK